MTEAFRGYLRGSVDVLLGADGWLQLGPARLHRTRDQRDGGKRKEETGRRQRGREELKFKVVYILAALRLARVSGDFSKVRAENKEIRKEKSSDETPKQLHPCNQRPITEDNAAACGEDVPKLLISRREKAWCFISLRESEIRSIK